MSWLLDMRPRGAGGGSSGAPADATYITQTPNATLTNEQALSALATGLLKNTTGTGVLSIGAPTVDFASAAQGALAGTALQPADIGVSVQAWDADLDTLAGLAKTKGNLIAGNGANWQGLPVGANGFALVADSLETSGLKWAAIVAGVSSVFGRTGAVVAALNDYPASFITNTPAGNIAAATVQAAINELDTEKQPLDATLTAYAALVGAADKLPYFTGADAFALADFSAFGRNLVDDADAIAGRSTLGLGSLAVISDAPSDGSFYGRQNAAWVAANTLPVVDETAIVYKTGNVAITQTHDVNAYTVARIVTWPDAAITVAGLQVSNLFTLRQDIRASGSGLAAGLYVPWITGDTLATLVAGSTNASNNRIAIQADSNTSDGVRATSVSSAAIRSTSTSGQGIVGTSTSGNGGQFVSGSSNGISCQSATGTPVDAIQTTGTDNAVNDLFVIRKRPLTTAAVGFGSALVYKLSSSTTVDQFVGRLSYEWADATHASRKARSKWTVYDTAEREAIRIEADGSNPMISFLGKTAIARPASYTLASTAGRVLPTPEAAFTGQDNAQAGSVYAKSADIITLQTRLNSVEGVLRQLIIDLASTSGYGLLVAS